MLTAPRLQLDARISQDYSRSLINYLIANTTMVPGCIVIAEGTSNRLLGKLVWIPAEFECTQVALGCSGVTRGAAHAEATL